MFEIQDGVLTIPKGVTMVGDWAFDGNTSLKNVVFHEKVKKIGTGAFWKCSALRSMELPAQLESIAGHAFGKCTALAELTISDTVVEIGTDAFLGCNALRTIHVRTGGETVTVELQQPFTEQQWPQVCGIAARKLDAMRAERAKEQAIKESVSRDTEARLAAQEARIAALEALVTAQQAQITQLTTVLAQLTARKPPVHVVSFHPLSEEELRRIGRREG